MAKNIYSQGIGLKEQRQGRDAGAVSGVIKVKIWTGVMIDSWFLKPIKQWFFKLGGQGATNRSPCNISSEVYWIYMYSWAHTKPKNMACEMPLRLGIHGCLATTWGRLTWPACSSRVRKWVLRRSTSLWTTGRSIQVDKKELKILNISDCRAGLPYQYKHRATLVWTSKFRPRNDIDKTVPESVHVNNWCVDISILFLLQGSNLVWCCRQTFGCLVVINSSPELTGSAG